ncbi:MAG: hypothetical protein ACHQT6_08475 [Candidatus Acidiferrales bacterium]
MQDAWGSVLQDFQEIVSVVISQCNREASSALENEMRIEVVLIDRTDALKRCVRVSPACPQEMVLNFVFAKYHPLDEKLYEYGNDKREEQQANPEYRRVLRSQRKPTFE